MRNIGILNPYSRNRDRRRDEDLSPMNLPEIDRARIAVEALEISIKGLLPGSDEARARFEAKLKAARERLAELETLKHSNHDFTACLDEDELPFELDGTHPSPQIVGGDVVEFQPYKPALIDDADIDTIIF